MRHLIGALLFGAVLSAGACGGSAAERPQSPVAEDVDSLPWCSDASPADEPRCRERMERFSRPLAPGRGAQYGETETSNK
jgi:hypothetical protein